jgi:hypothetical protein
MHCVSSVAMATQVGGYSHGVMLGFYRGTTECAVLWGGKLLLSVSSGITVPRTLLSYAMQSSGRCSLTNLS